MTILQWLKSKSELQLTNDDSYTTIIQERGSDPQVDWLTLSKDERELMQADLYYQLYMFPTQVTEQSSSQGFSHSQSVQNGRSDRYLSMALAIYQRLDEDKYVVLSAEKGSVRPLRIKHNW